MKIFDACVLGAGPAGIVAALELAAKGLTVALVESGTAGFEAQAQRLSDGDILTPESHSVMEDAVRRELGGTSALWGGRCVPLDRCDHVFRDYVAHSGWPVAYDELAAYYERACQYLGAGPADFTVAECKQLQTSKELLSAYFRNSADVSEARLERWSIEPHLWRAHGKRIKATPEITLITGRTCVGFNQVRQDDSVSAAVLRATLGEGEPESLHARVFVLACGGVESTRLVLASMEDESGLKVSGARHVGRYYMGHPSGKIADVALAGDPEKTLFGFERDGTVYVRRRLTLSEELMKHEKLLNIAFWLDNPELGDWRHGSGVLSAAYLGLTMPVLGNLLAPAAIRKRLSGQQGSAKFKHWANCLRSPVTTANFVVRFIHSRYFSKPRLPGFFTYSSNNRYALHFHAEHAPHHDSCITLSDKRDALGLRRARIALVWGQRDIDSVIRAHQILDRALQSAGIGRLEYRYAGKALEEAIQAQAVDGFHQIGTLRMADTPENGVTDSVGRVFGTQNLYVASSAVFPTSGQANPTLALAALTIRQAEHISRTLKGH